MFAGFKQGYQEAAEYIFMSHTDSGTLDAQNDSADQQLDYPFVLPLRNLQGISGMVWSLRGLSCDFRGDDF